MKQRFIKWDEPTGLDCTGGMECCAPDMMVIAFQHNWAKKLGRVYPNDEMALDDFIVVNWARTVIIDEEGNIDED